MARERLTRGTHGHTFGLAAGLGVALLLAACSPAVPPQEPVRAVKVLTVGSTELDSQIEFSGEVRARTESQLGFRVSGKMIARQVEVGQKVKPGQLLAQIDPQDYQLAANAARSQVAAALTNRDLAASDFKRYKELTDKNFISGAELERREAALKAAQAQLEQAQAQSAAQGNQALYTDLRSDVSGVVTAVMAEPGQVVAAGSPVIRVARDGARDAVFAVPEDRVSRLALGTKVQVHAWNQTALEDAVVREIGAAADPVTRTFGVKVALPASDASPLGSTVYVQLQPGHDSRSAVVKLPTSALRQEGKGSAVWVLDKASMQVRSVPVTVATADGNEAVISAGLTPGLLVVSTGVHVLNPGQKVTIYQAPPAVVAAPAVLASKPAGQ